MKYFKIFLVLFICLSFYPKNVSAALGDACTGVGTCGEDVCIDSVCVSQEDAEAVFEAELAATTATSAAPATTPLVGLVLINPLGETDFRLLFARVISAALSIIGSLALLMFVYGGVVWLTSRGDQKAITTGKDTLTWATLGLVVIFASYVIVSALITGITTGAVS